MPVLFLLEALRVIIVPILIVTHNICRIEDNQNIELVIQDFCRDYKECEYTCQ